MENEFYYSDLNIWLMLDFRSTRKSPSTIHWIKWDSEFCYLKPLMKPLVAAGLFGDAYRDTRVSHENLGLVKSCLENIRQSVVTMPPEVDFQCNHDYVIDRKKSGKLKFGKRFHQISMKRVLELHRVLKEILEKAEDKKVGIIFSGD